jgi:hypothetical protein
LCGAILLAAALAVIVPRLAWLSKVSTVDSACLHATHRTWDGTFGRIGSCTAIDRRARLFGEPSATAYLLLRTDHGLAVVRADYDDSPDLCARQQEREEGREVPADQVPAGALSDDDLRQLRVDVDGRGGIDDIAESLIGVCRDG